jgi:ethanolamine utilization protein EutN
MQLAKVVGQVVSTIKEPGLDSFKILLVENLDPSDPDEGGQGSYMAVDLVGAGEGEVVIVTHGSAARVHPATSHTATDAAVVGIVDSVVVAGRVTFKK